jgi:hypothetical protein
MRTGFAVDAPATAPAEWNGSVTVGGSAVITLRNCGAGTLTVQRVIITGDDHFKATLDFDDPRATLVPGASLDVTARGAPIPMTMHLHAIAIADGATVVAETKFDSIEDPKRKAAREACDARHGRFGPAGMLGHEACDAPTGDAGKRCTSRAGCESACIADRSEVVSASTPGAPTCGARMDVRHMVGHCFERTLLFGCHAFLDEEKFECVPVGGGVHLSSTCVD